MELTKFCPRCGQKTEELHGDSQKLCPSCYPDKKDLLEIPDEVKIVYCSVCGRMRDKGEWIEEYSIQDQLGAKFAEFNKEDVTMNLQYWEEDEDVFVKVHAEKGKIRDEYEVRIEFEKEQCEPCSRFSGGFYKVKIQLRGDGDLDKASEWIADKSAELTNENRKNFLSNIEKNDHGYDIFLSTEDMAKEILDMLKSKTDPEVKRSYELIGERDGQEVYRNVISVRIS